MSFRAALRLALCSVLLAMLGACSSLPFLSKPQAEAADAEPPRPAQFRIEVDAPQPLRTLLLQHLDLARLQYAAEADALTPTEIDRLVGAASAQAQSLLETEGHFNPVVSVRRADDGAVPPLLRMQVDPGPRTVVDRLTLEIQGGIGDEIAGGDAAAVALQRAIEREWPLQPGVPFQQSAWDSAKNGVLAALRSNGYLAASWSGTAAQVHADRNTVRLFLVADSGALFRVGEIRSAGLQRYDEGAVLPMARELHGRAATEQVLRDAQDRMLSLGLFESVVLDVDANAPDPSAAPLLLAVRELPLQQATVGIGYTDDLGIQASLEYTHRNLFGTRWMTHHKLQVGSKQNAWTGDLISHMQDDGYRNLLAGNAEKLESDDETRLSWYLRAGRTRDTIRIWRLYYAEYAQARLETSAGINDSSALSANYHWVRRDVDDLRTPTRGNVWSLQGAFGWSQGTSTDALGLASVEDSGPFARAYARLMLYEPLGNSFYGSARVELGQVFVRDSLSVPDTLLFRAGGDDSVRGYAFRSLGPEIGGVTVGGNALFTASAQVARPIFADQPAFLWALFVDAGNASDGWKNMRPVFGYGAGLHWRSPVGPLRIDLAYGQEVRKVRLHFSVGVVF